MKEIRLDGFIETFKSASKIVITNHTNPDGDAMGSALALQQVLEKMGKKVSVVVPNPYPKFLWHLHGNERVLIYAEGKTAGNEVIEEADRIFHLDYNLSLNQIGRCCRSPRVSFLWRPYYEKKYTR